MAVFSFSSRPYLSITLEISFDLMESVGHLLRVKATVGPLVPVSAGRMAVLYCVLPNIITATSTFVALDIITSIYILLS